MKHYFLNGFGNAVVKAVDVDFITLFLIHLSLLDSPYEIEVGFNFGKGRPIYEINDVFSKSTPEQKLELMFFVAFTGCGITFWFFDISKCTFMQEHMVSEWINYKKRTTLSWTLDKDKENNFNMI